MKVVIYCPIKQDATSFYRGFGPWRRLAISHNVQLVDLTIEGQTVSWDLMIGADVLFIQRPSAEIDNKIIEIARECNLKIWIDYDDDYLNIPKTNPRHELYGDPHRVEQIRRAILNADLISVSTPAIGKSIAERFFNDMTGEFVVIPNAVDDELFDISIPTHEELGNRDVIMWRGGDTHDSDLAPYMDAIVEMYNKYPKYTWAFVGHVPYEFLKRIDNSRILLYPWEDVMIYFDRLMELRPFLTIVPWEENVFNASKSNCSWLEATLAGSAVLFPIDHSEFAHGMIGYRGVESFKDMLDLTLSVGHFKDNVINSFDTIREKYSLSVTNKERYGLLHGLDEGKKKFGFRNPKYSNPVREYTAEEFFKYTFEKRYNQENENYRNGHWKAADTLLERYAPESIIEIGCGPGPMLERFLDMNVPQVLGFDINPYFKEYFVDRRPHYAEFFKLQDFSEVQLDGVFDLGISIEVMEHMPADYVDELIAKLAHHFKRFYFSSTPYRTSKTFDQEWGHINVRTTDRWIKTFEERGWIYIENPKLICNWDLIFESSFFTQTSSLLVLGAAVPEPSGSLLQSSPENAVANTQSAPGFEFLRRSPDNGQ